MLDTLEAIPHAVERRTGPSRLLMRLYRDIGLAAVAVELDLLTSEFDADLEDSIERGARYLMPRKQRLAS